MGSQGEQVNEAVSQGERVVLPRIRDFVQGLLRLLRAGKPIDLLAVDIRDAFHNVPVGAERKFTTAVFRGSDGLFRLVLYNCLVFGSGSSPTVWGRFAELLGRSTAAVVGDMATSELQIYVDDPAFAAAGTQAEREECIAVFLLWLAVLGFPIAWDKAYAGRSIEWGGANIAVDVDCGEVHVSIPPSKLEPLLEEAQQLESQALVSKRRLRTFAAKMSFVAGLIFHMKAFLSAIWATLGGPRPGSGESALAKPSRGK